MGAPDAALDRKLGDAVELLTALRDGLRQRAPGDLPLARVGAEVVHSGIDTLAAACGVTRAVSR
jgi:hypothetical protein